MTPRHITSKYHREMRPKLQHSPRRHTFLLLSCYDYIYIHAYVTAIYIYTIYIVHAEWNMMQIVWDLCFCMLPTNNPRHTTLHHSKPRRKTFIFYRDFESNTYFTKLFSCLILKTPGSALRLFLGIITYIGTYRLRHIRTSCNVFNYIEHFYLIFCSFLSVFLDWTF